MLSNLIYWKRNINTKKIYSRYDFYFDKRDITLESILTEFVKMAKDSSYDEVYDMFLQDLVDFKEWEYFKEYYCYIEADQLYKGLAYDFQLSESFNNKVFFSTLKGKIQFEYFRDNFAKELLQLPKIAIIIHHNFTSSKWDNATNPKAYKYKRGLKIYQPNDKIRFPNKMVDISDRPGRTSKTKDFLWRGGHEYWFGESFYEICARDKLLSFNDALEVSLMDDDFVHIKLMEPKDYWTDEGQQRLKALRDLLEVDRLEQEFIKARDIY